MTNWSRFGSVLGLVMSMGWLAGCSEPPGAVAGGGDSAPASGDESGSATIAVAIAPAGAQCLVVNAVTSANMTVSKQFALTAGSASTGFSFGTLPNGPTSFSGYVYNVACASVGSNQPTYQADPVLVTIMGGATITVTMNVRPINPVVTNINFVPNVVSVAAGEMSTFITTSGAPQQWGWQATNNPLPSAVPGLADAVQISAGYYHACALRADGSVWCWGSNGNGQLGPNVALGAFSSTPVQVPLTGPITMLAAGWFHTCAYRASGGTGPATYCWGYNSNGQLGNNTTTQSATPVQAMTTYTLRSLAAGGYFTIAATNDGHILSWGSNANGQLGDGSKTDHWLPTNSYGVATVQQVVGGYGHSCALRADGTAQCWGSNTYGQLGDATTVDHLNPAPIAAVIPGPLKQLTAGTYHSCGRTTDGRVFCWGYGYDGEIGDLAGVSRSSPTQVSFGGLTASALATGMYHNCALLSSLSLVCWGANAEGQIGDGTYNSEFGPVPVMF